MIKYSLIAIIAFFCESIDSSLGMGYGTILTPVLLLMGYKPLEIVPLILFSEFFTGILAAILHHKRGNVNLQIGTNEFKTALLLTFCSIFGTVFAAYMAFSLNEKIIKIYIAILLILIGLTSFITLDKKYNFSWNKIISLGLLASFNKGISGGGYGPILTGGQMLAGINSKSAIGITSLAEGFTCFVGVLSFIYLNGFNFDLSLGLALLCGALMSIPISVNIVSFFSENNLRSFLSLAMVGFGLINILIIIKPLNILKYPYILLLLLLVILLVIIKLWNGKVKEHTFKRNKILNKISKADQFK